MSGTVARLKRPVRAGRSLRGAEDVVGANPAPHDVCLTRRDLGPELPGGSAIRREGHLQKLVGALHLLHPKPRSKRPSGFQILNEASDGDSESRLLVPVQALPILVEAG